MNTNIKKITEFDIEWLLSYDENQNDAIFYCEGYEHSPICVISGNDRKVLIVCNGEMKIVYELNNEEFIIQDFWDLMRAGINTDEDLEKLDEYERDCNPWFEAYDITEIYKEKMADLLEIFAMQDIGKDIPSLEIDEDDLRSLISQINNYITAYK